MNRSRHHTNQSFPTPLLLLTLLFGSTCSCSDTDVSLEARALDEEARLWEAVSLCGEPAEHFTTVLEMADAADAVVVGRLISVDVGNVVDTDTPEDFYGEYNVTVKPGEVLRGEIEGPLRFSLIATTVHDHAAIESQASALNGLMPTGEVLLLLRARTDLEDLYITLGDTGLWTETTRHALDNPIAHSACGGHTGDEVRALFMLGAGSLEEAVEMLR